MQALINFKLSCDVNYLKAFNHLEPYQYIEPFLNLSDHEVFVDIGGFDGHTSRFFIEQVGSYEHIYFFEPDEKNLTIAKNKLEDFNNITYYPFAVSDKKTQFYFSSTGSTSKQDETGDTLVYANSLDNLIQDRITFIKMDIEGAEESAILGAKRLIRDYTPKLAICVYHKSSDIWRIPELIFSINDGYDIYLRHYTESIYETVMYFVPK
jgi:FkbM family methyltransferase